MIHSAARAATIGAARVARIRAHKMRFVTAQLGAWKRACRDFILTCFELHQSVGRLICEVLLRMPSEYYVFVMWSSASHDLLRSTCVYFFCASFVVTVGPARCPL